MFQVVICLYNQVGYGGMEVENLMSIEEGDY